MTKLRLGKCKICNNEGKVIQTKDNKILCKRCYNREFARKYNKNPLNRERINSNKRIWFFLFGKEKATKYDYRSKRWMIQEKLGFFDSGGCCWVCGETDPFSLETHHISKQNLMNLCGSCHQILDRMGWDYLINERGRLD